MLRSRYPRCSSLRVLKGLPHDTIVEVRGMSLSKYGDAFHLSDGEEHMRILSLPSKLKDRFSGSNDHLFGVDMFVRVNAVEEHDYYSYMRSPVEYYYYEPRPSKCNCGAAHTFLNNHHSEWCDSHILE